MRLSIFAGAMSRRVRGRDARPRGLGAAPLANHTADRARILGLLFLPAAVVLAVKLVTTHEDVLTVGRDVQVYAAYGGQFLSGAIPYRDFHLEYPPLALVPMVAPLLAWPFGRPDLELYSWLFTASSALMAVVCGGLIAMLARRPIGALATWSLLVGSACIAIAWRYDVWPAVLVLAAVVAAERGRPDLAGVAVGLGTMMKLFPIVLLPILLVRAATMNDRRAILRLVGTTGAVIAGVVLVSVLVAGSNASQWLDYQLQRGLQIETTGAGVLLLAHALEGLPISVSNGFESMQVHGPGVDVFAGAATWLEIGLVGIVLVAVTLRFRAEMRSEGTIAQATLATAATAGLVALIVPSKVFSAQYVVWFLPLVPLLPTPKRWLAIGIAGLSTLIYPLNYTALWRLDPTMAALLDVRNVLLVALFVWCTVDLWRGSLRAPADEPTTPGSLALARGRAGGG